MKQSLEHSRPVPVGTHRHLLLLSNVVAGLWLFVASSCDTGTPTSRIQNVSIASEILDCLTEQRSDYQPYFTTGDMNRPRYLFAGATNASGLVYVTGGSDERGLSTIDTVEFYDQSKLDRDAVPPESLTGVWVDTNFEGDPMVLTTGPRIYHTVTNLGSTQLVVIGGAANILAGKLYEKAELFDAETRTFEPTEEEMMVPRFRHTTIQLGSGNLAIVGGQYRTTVTVINELIPEGFPGREQQVTVFPTTPSAEMFDVTEQMFELVRVVDTGDPSELKTRLGRGDHVMTRIAGSDDRLNTGDDVFLVIGGLMTLSAVSGLAPRTKLPGLVGRTEGGGVTSFEVFDPQTNVFTLISSVALTATRANGVQAPNLGVFNDFTPDGVEGMGNAVLVTHGNVDAACPVTPWTDQLIVANFIPGSGPAGGIRLFQVEELNFLSHEQHAEYPTLGPITRCATNVVALPRPFETVPGVPDRETWILTFVGVGIYCCPCAYDYDSPGMLAGCAFDPYFSLPAALLNNLSPRDLITQRRSQVLNPLGIIGCWFVFDDFDMVPWRSSDGMEKFQTTPQTTRWAVNRGKQRVFGINFQIPGVDGNLDTIDDRVLIAGGGRSYPLQGGEPTSPSAEIFVPPPACGEEI